MKILSIKTLAGRNIYSHKPIIKILLDLEELHDKTTLEFDHFNDALLQLFPDLIKHHCGLEKHGGFVERISQGTYFGHVVEHLVLELQVLLGYEVFFGKTRIKKEPAIYNLIIEYANEHVAIECVKQAIYIVESMIKNKDVDYYNIMQDLEEIRDKHMLGPSAKAIFDEAKRRKIPVRRLGNESILELGYGKYSRLTQAALTDSTSNIAIEISCNKELTKQLLMENIIPTPSGGVANSVEDAIEIAHDIGFPVVLKPLDGNQGKGVVLNVNSPLELQNLFEIPLYYSNNVIVERHIKGNDYRVLVINNKVSAVAERIAPQVIGDGIHTIKELVEIENSNTSRGYGHEKPQTKIEFDPIIFSYLNKDNLTEDSIPKPNEIIQLRLNGNISTGGSARECTAEIHPDNAKLAVDAAKIIGLDIAGVDITTEDISKSILQHGGAIIEVNAVPGLRMHLHPTKGDSINIASDILDFYYPEGTPYSVPIVAVTGTNGKTTTTRLMGHALSLSGDNVGMTTSSGTYINNQCVQKGDNTGPLSARTVLSSKDIDIAVLEVARGGIVRRGLGYDLADVAIWTNIGNDHIGIDGIECKDDLAFAKSLVVEAVKPDGCSVLNADDKMIDYFMRRASGNVILYSKNHNNELVLKHVQSGNKALCVEENCIYIYNSFEKVKLIELSEVPITFNGTLKCNVENALAAASALYALQIPIETIKEGLRAFQSNAEMNPGRFNIFELDNVKVMIDYGHNIGGYEEVGEFINNLQVQRAIGVIGIPGDRPDEQIFNVGVKCAEIFSKVYIKEDKELRGRRPGEVANLLYKGLTSTNFNEERIKYIPSEIEALKTAISQSEEGDFITFFHEEFTPAMNFITQLQEQSIKEIMLAKTS